MIVKKGATILNKAFFLDRDGTINKDMGYVGDPDKLELLPGAAEGIRLMNEAGYLVIVVSNQSGVARGYFTPEDVERVNHRLNEMLEENGAHIDAFYFCPHLPDGAVKEYAVECDCRKPKLGLFRQAIEDFELDAKECYACGDRSRDVEGLVELGVPSAHLGIIDEEYKDGHYTSMENFFRCAETSDRWNGEKTDYNRYFGRYRSDLEPY